MIWLQIPLLYFLGCVSVVVGAIKHDNHLAVTVPVDTNFTFFKPTFFQFICSRLVYSNFIFSKLVHCNKLICFQFICSQLAYSELVHYNKLIVHIELIFPVNFLCNPVSLVSSSRIFVSKLSASIFYTTNVNNRLRSIAGVDYISAANKCFDISSGLLLFGIPDVPGVYPPPLTPPFPGFPPVTIGSDGNPTVEPEHSSTTDEPSSTTTTSSDSSSSTTSSTSSSTPTSTMVAVIWEQWSSTEESTSDDDAAADFAQSQIDSAFGFDFSICHYRQWNTVAFNFSIRTTFIARNNVAVIARDNVTFVVRSAADDYPASHDLGTSRGSWMYDFHGFKWRYLHGVFVR
ncbi:hypothetical protein F5X97DRAFT_324970 [Nemania serpens]|nr:hypothetical protein F5X97DRAFT_324970 [Nemania serpens]